MGRDIVHLHGTVAPLGRDVHFPFIAFVHACEGNLPAHDEVTHHEQRRELVPFRGVEDGSVYKTAGVMHVDDAAGRAFAFCNNSHENVVTEP